jgi:hypothetical protein
VDEFVIMKPRKLEMSNENYFRFDHLIMCLCIYLSLFLF